MSHPPRSRPRPAPTPRGKVWALWPSSAGHQPCKRPGLATLWPKAGINPGKVNPNDNGSPSIGVTQWHADRIARMEAHLGKPITQASVAEQAEGVDWELRTYYPDLWKKLKAAKTTAEASALYTQFFEVPANAAQVAQDRIPASQAMEEYAVQPPGAAPAPAPAPSPVGAGSVHVHVTTDGNATATVKKTTGPVTATTAPAMDYSRGY